MRSEKPSEDGTTGHLDSFSGGFFRQIKVGQGRSEVMLNINCQGRDWVMQVTGGQAHVGAVATATAEAVDLSVVGIHKEGPLAEMCARAWAQLTGGVCVAMVGIHQDQATAQEIKLIVLNVELGLERLKNQWQQWTRRLQSQDLESLMINWCHEAAEMARSFYRETGVLEFKYGSEAVTEADRCIETLLRARICEAFPEDSIVGEEFGGPDLSTQAPGGRVWQIDPIDGTLNFAQGLPDYCISLALMSGHDVLAACVHQPATGDVYSAVKGQGARLNGDTIKVDADRNLKEAVVSVQLKADGSVMSDAAVLRSVLSAPFKLRKGGAVALEMAWVAAGFYDLLLASFKGKIHLWDIAAGLLLIEEAGGVVVDFNNQPYQLESSEMMAGSAQVAFQLMPLLSAESK